MPDTDPANNPNTETPQEEATKSPKRSAREKRPLSIWRRLFRMLLVVLIFFGLGALLVIFTLYIPLRDQLSVSREQINELVNQPDIELEAANEEINRLATIEEKCIDNQTRLELLIIHSTITELKLEATNAKLALVSENPDQAALALDKTAKKIADLKELLPITQQKYIDNLEKRLELILAEIEEDQFAAISDLEVMLEILNDLEM